MQDKNLTDKQVYILIVAIITAIAFLESGYSWRDFGLKVLVYGAVSAFVAILLGTMQRNK